MKTLDHLPSCLCPTCEAAADARTDAWFAARVTRLPTPAVRPLGASQYRSGMQSSVARALEAASGAHVAHGRGARRR